MKLAIMQPYLFPYLGYFQLMNAVDIFVFHNDIQYIKGGYINRNRILDQNLGAVWITLPLKKASAYDAINTRMLCDPNDKKKLLRQIENTYRKAPFFHDTIELLTEIILFEELNLFKYIENSIHILSAYLKMKTQFLKSEDMKLGSLKAQERVLEICQVCEAIDYINPIGGVELYDKAAFHAAGINLSFLKMNDVRYKQFDTGSFIPYLSIIDVMMFNAFTDVKKFVLCNYDLI
jgi:hypothetical protein